MLVWVVDLHSLRLFLLIACVVLLLDVFISCLGFLFIDLSGLVLWFILGLSCYDYIYYYVT